MIALLIGVSLALILLSWAWANGIHNMNEKHPDYKGDDFLNWDGKNTDWDKVPTNAGRDGWDDNIVHTEGDF